MAGGELSDYLGEPMKGLFLTTTDLQVGQSFLEDQDILLSEELYNY